MSEDKQDENGESVAGKIADAIRQARYNRQLNVAEADCQRKESDNADSH